MSTERFLKSPVLLPDRHLSGKTQERWATMRECVEGRAQQLADEIAEGGSLTEIQKSLLTSYAEQFLAGEALHECFSDWMTLIHDPKTGEQDLAQSTSHAAATAGSLKGVLDVQTSLLKELKKPHPRKPG